MGGKGITSGKLKKTTPGPAPSPLDETDHKILSHLDKYPNASYKDLGALVGMSKAGLAKRYNRPVFQAALVELNKTTWDLILRAKKIAARRLMTLANDKDPWVAIKAAGLLFGPTLQDTNINVNTVQEIIYKTKFGDGGQIISEKEEINEAPKNALELLNGRE